MPGTWPTPSRSFSTAVDIGTISSPQTGDTFGMSGTYDSIGYAQHHLGHYSEAIISYQRSLDLKREVGERQGEANTSNHLGDTYHVLGDHAAAHAAWQQAFEIFDALHHPDAEQVRSKLEDTT